MESSPRNAWEEAVIAFGGPVFGGAAAGAVSIYAMQYDSQFAYALATSSSCFCIGIPGNLH